MSKGYIKIGSKTIDQHGNIWYVVRVKDMNPRMLQYEINCIFGKDRIIKIIVESEKKVLVIVEK